MVPDISNTSIKIESNFSIYQNENEIPEIPTASKIFGLIMFLIGCFGILTIIGIIHYEKYGQDPQKRSFSDQIFTFNCKIFMIVCPIFWGITQIRWLFGPIGHNLAIFRSYLASSLLCIPLGCTESILFQCLIIFSWKKCAMINDEFFAMFINFTNFMVVQMISVIRLMTGQLYTKYFQMLSGVEVHVQNSYV